jgi:hypothetical protein
MFSCFMVFGATENVSQQKRFLWSTISYIKMAENSFKNINQFPEKALTLSHHSYPFQLLYG